MDEKFNLAVKTINSLHINPSNEINLKIYAYFKQSCEGNISFERPSILNLKGRAKWDAWKKLENMDKEIAMANYIALAYSLSNNEQLKI